MRIDTIVASFYNFIIGDVEVGFAVMGSNSVNIFAPSIEGFGTAVVIGGTGLGAGWVAPCKPVGTDCSDTPQRMAGWPAKTSCGWPTIKERWPCTVENQTWNGDTTWLYNSFLGVGGVGVRLRAGNEHGIVSPRLTQVNATIVEERDPYTKNGQRFESHDYIVYPGYPDSGNSCDVPGDCANPCVSTAPCASTTYVVSLWFSLLLSLPPFCFFSFVSICKAGH